MKNLLCLLLLLVARQPVMFSALAGKVPTDKTRHLLDCTSHRRTVDQVVDSFEQEALGCPAEIAATSEFEMDEIIDNRIFDSLGPFVVI